MKAIVITLALLNILACSAEYPADGASGCVVEEFAAVAPSKVKQIKLGMSKDDLRRILGEEDYSPVEGQYYFSTGGECPLDAGNRMAPCGLVAEFRAEKNGELQLTERLQSCWWGAIGE